MADQDRVRRWIVQHRDVYGVTGYWLERVPGAPLRTAVPETRPTKSPAAAVRETVAAPFTPRASRADASATLDVIAREIRACRACPLGKTRLHAVPGEGNPAAEIMFVGEGPGYAEDHQGRPFVGKAGELLTKIIQAMGLTRADVFIANVVKCHPMKNPDPELRNNDRPPTDEEIRGCRRFLERQIAAVHPRIIVALGGVSSRALLATAAPITALRGTFTPYPPDSSILVMPTFHPAALLRDPGLKKPLWEDMKAVLAKLGRNPPSRG